MKTSTCFSPFTFRNPIFSLLSGITTFSLIILFLAGCDKDDDNAPADSCSAFTPVTPVGRMTVAGNVFTYRTSGGGTIEINTDTAVRIYHDSYPNLKLEFWGNLGNTNGWEGSRQHESLNGKHIKDRIDSTTRTIIFPDGAKITMVASSFSGPLVTVSIYDGAESHIIRHGCRRLIHSSTDPAVALQKDNAEADGEAGGFTISATGLLFENLYMEPTPGNRTNNTYPLGELFLNNPTNVNDYYDDPRLGHT